MEKLCTWLASMGFEGNVALGDNYGFEREDNTIVLGSVGAATSAAYRDFMRNAGFGAVGKYGDDTLAFLHELGHYFTLSEFSEAELLLFSFSKDEAEPHAYWSCPDEWAANVWAGEFMGKCPEAAGELDDILSSLSW